MDSKKKKKIETSEHSVCYSFLIWTRFLIREGSPGHRNSDGGGSRFLQITSHSTRQQEKEAYFSTQNITQKYKVKLLSNYQVVHVSSVIRYKWRPRFLLRSSRTL